MDALSVMVEAGIISASTAIAVLALWRKLESEGLKQPSLQESIKSRTPTVEVPKVVDMDAPAVTDMNTPHTRYMG